jgi:wobble nucleotide-excising tRNase
MTYTSCLQEINYLTSSTSKLPYTAAFSSTIPNLYTKNVSNLNVASQDAQSELDSSSQARDLRDDNKTSTRRQQQRRTEDNISNLIQQQGTTALQDDKSMSFDTSSEDSQSRKVEKVSDTPSTISDIEVPDNVDEVAMINNVINIANERKKRDKSNHSSAASKGLTEEEQLVGYRASWMDWGTTWS